MQENTWFKNLFEPKTDGRLPDPPGAVAEYTLQSQLYLSSWEREGMGTQRPV